MVQKWSNVVQKMSIFKAMMVKSLTLMLMLARLYLKLALALEGKCWGKVQEIQGVKDPPLRMGVFLQRGVEITWEMTLNVFVPILILVIFLISLFDFETRFSLVFLSILKTLRILLSQRWINTAFDGIFSLKQIIVGL